jgi:uncharacterized protein
VKIFSTFIFIISGFLSVAQSYTVETVPNKKLIDGSYVSNPDTIITLGTEATINRILRELEDSTTAEVAVVMLNSIGDVDEVDFSQRLFALWKPGKAINNNGLLILYVADRKVIRFQTGSGIEGVMPDITCKRIQMSDMVPNFQNGNVDQGMIDGIRSVARVLSDPEVAESYKKEDQFDVDVADFSSYVMGAWLLVTLFVFWAKSKNKSFATASMAVKPQAKLTSSEWFVWYIFLPLLVMVAATFMNSFVGFAGGMYAWTGVALLLRRNVMDKEASRWEASKDYHTIYNFFQQEQGLFSALRFVFPIPFAFMYRGFKKKMQYFRDHPRDCNQCGKPLLKLDEKADDSFLSKSQLMEEGLKSVDYDIWKCSACNAADRLSYVNASSKYKTCPKCQTHAYHQVSDSVISAATTTSTGTGEEIHACKFCNERTVRRYTIPMVESSSSSSSSSGSSGGSWGGGSSSGGGASSSW